MKYRKWLTNVVFRSFQEHEDPSYEESTETEPENVPEKKRLIFRSDNSNETAKKKRRNV